MASVPRIDHYFVHVCDFIPAFDGRASARPKVDLQPRAAGNSGEPDGFVTTHETVSRRGPIVFRSVGGRVLRGVDHCVQYQKEFGELEGTIVALAIDEKGRGAIDSAEDAAVEIGADVIGELSLFQCLA